MVECNKVNVKLTNTQLNKLKTAVKNKTGTTFKMILKMFDENDPPHESLLTKDKKQSSEMHWITICQLI